MIVVDCLGKKFSQGWIFRNLSLSVQTGESVVLLGQSGSGKSVLLKIIAGLLTPDEGQVQAQSSDLGMLFQNNALFDSLTVEENLLFPLKEKFKIATHQALKKVNHFLAQVGLDKAGKLYPHEISGGMKKRLGIARALIIEPEIILYDEPTAGLDPITSKSIADLILKLKNENKTTVLTVTNDIFRAYQLGDRIFLLALGKLILGGTADEVRRSQDPAIRQFVSGLLEGPLTPKLV